MCRLYILHYWRAIASGTMDEEHLPQDTYELVVVGTGLVECILAGAAARVGKRVVHLDPNEFYGADWGSFALKDISAYTRAPKPARQPPAACDGGNSDSKERSIRALPTEPGSRFDHVEEWRTPAPNLSEREATERIQSEFLARGDVSTGDTVCPSASAAPW
jgi:hypothetical protein